jgi:hypothetical protein
MEYDMNARTGAVMVGIALLAAGCGSKGHVTSGLTTQQRYQQAVAFSQCMRSHGAPNFPDPGPGGAFPVTPGSDRSSAAFKAAQAACKSKEPNGPPAAADLQRDYQRMLRFSSCMRAHGMPNFPNPVLEQDGVTISDKRIDRNSPQFMTAHAACRSLEPGPGNP